MMQQLCTSMQMQWKRQAMPRPSKTKPLIWPVHRGPTLNVIMPKLNNIKYLSLVGSSFGDHYLKLDEISLYLTILACQFGK